MDRAAREEGYWNQKAGALVNTKNNAISDNWRKRKELIKKLLDYDLWDKSILEIGCGFATTTGFLMGIHGGGFDYVGTDIAPTFHKTAHKLFGLKTMTARADSLPFEADQFDICFAFDVLEHIHPDDRARVALEFDRVLKPASRMFINSPHPANPSGHDDEFEHWFTDLDLVSLSRALKMNVDRMDLYGIDIPGAGLRRYYFIVMSRDETFESGGANG